MRKAILIQRTLLFLIALGIASNGYSQEIKIGQPIPDIEFGNVLNFNDGNLKISDFKGKLIILDFWSPFCLSCIEGFPILDSLQKYFSGKIQILLVNMEDRNSTIAFFAKRKRIKMPDLPMITSDSILNRFFPHSGVPHHVWIDTNNIIRYSTYSFFATKNNINRFLSGEELGLVNLRVWSKLESLFDQTLEKRPSYYSYIGNCINGGSVHLENSPQNDENSISTDICMSAMELYQMAFNESQNIYYYKFTRPGRTALEVSDTFKYKRPDDPDKLQFWISNYSYYYQLFLPKEKKDEKYKIMKDDLRRFFSLNPIVEKRKIKCLVLERTSKIDKLKTRGGIEKNTFRRADERDTEVDSVRELKNIPFSIFTKKIQEAIEIHLNEPFYDDTKYYGKIDLIMKGESLDMPSVDLINEGLKKYDLRLGSKEIEMDILVLKDSFFVKKK